MKNQNKTKKRAVSEANVDEKQKEIYDFLYESFAARAKARQIIEEYLENPKGNDTEG